MVVLAFSHLSAETEGVSSGDWSPIRSGATVSMADGSMKVKDKEIPVRTFIYTRFGNSLTNAVGVPIAVNLMERPFISFRVKMELPPGAPDNFVVTLFDEDGEILKNEVNSLSTKFFDHVTEVAPGEYEFVWDGRKKFQEYDISTARYFGLIYSTSQIPENETVKITVSAVSFQK